MVLRFILVPLAMLRSGARATGLFVNDRRLDDGTTATTREGAVSSWHVSDASEPIHLTDKDGYPVVRVRYTVAEQDFEVGLYESDCVTEVTDPNAFRVEASKTAFYPAEAAMDVTVDLTILPDVLSGTDLWNAADDGGGGGDFRVCLSLGLRTAPGPEGLPVMRRDTIYDVGVTRVVDIGGKANYHALVDGYSTAGSAVVSDNENDSNDELSIDFKVTVDGYVCDPDNNYARVSNPEPFKNFDVLTVCALAAADDSAITIKNIQTLTLDQTVVGGGVIKFEAVAGGKVPEPHVNLVNMGCEDIEGEHVCHVTTVLLTNFYEVGNGAQINVYGDIALSFAPPGSSKGNYNFMHTVNLFKEKECDKTSFLDSIISFFFGDTHQA